MKQMAAELEMYHNQVGCLLSGRSPIGDPIYLLDLEFRFFGAVRFKTSKRRLTATTRWV